MGFEEALERLAKTDPKEIDEGAVRLVEDEGTGNRFLIHGSADGPQVEIRFHGGEPWFTYAQMATIFGVDETTVIHHVQNFLDNGELADATTAKFAVVGDEGGRKVTRTIRHFGLDVAFYVGYRVNSTEGVQFRRWATDVLVRFATKGFVVDVRRLKSPDTQPDRVAELRDIVEDIRADEANVYREVRALCATCKDYDPKSRAWQAFYARMQNKLFWATVQMVATAVRLTRADASKDQMGLVSWSGERPIQKDALIGKNYLAKPEVARMNRLAVMLLDFIRDQLAEEHIATMVEMERALDGFIKQTNRPLLPAQGVHIPTKTEADEHCKEQYRLFNARRAKLEDEGDTRTPAAEPK